MTPPDDHDTSFIASVPYHPLRPGVLVVYCSDGRITGAVEELLVHRVGHESMDRLCVPGGPAVLTYTAASYAERDAAARSARFLIENHGIRRVVLVGHQRCAYYLERMRASPPEVVETRQIDDLRAAAAFFRHLKAPLDIRAYMARVERRRLSFELVKTAATRDA